MTNDNENENDNRIELISLNEFDEIDENDIELGDEDERPFPDSDEAIRALQDVAEAVDEMEIEIARLRAERCEAERTILRLESQYGVAVKDRDVARVERDEARRLYCMEKANPPPVNYSHPVSHDAVASHHNWDCFNKEETK